MKLCYRSVQEVEMGEMGRVDYIKKHMALVQLELEAKRERLDAYKKMEKKDA